MARVEGICEGRRFVTYTHTHKHTHTQTHTHTHTHTHNPSPLPPATRNLTQTCTVPHRHTSPTPKHYDYLTPKCNPPPTNLERAALAIAAFEVLNLVQCSVTDKFASSWLNLLGFQVKAHLVCGHACMHVRMCCVRVFVCERESVCDSERESDSLHEHTHTHAHTHTHIQQRQHQQQQGLLDPLRPSLSPSLSLARYLSLTLIHISGMQSQGSGNVGTCEDRECAHER